MDNTSISKYTLESILLHFTRIIRGLIIIILVEFIAIVSIIFGVFWYVSLPVEEVSDSQTIEDVQNSDVSQIIGDGYGESEADKDIQEESSTK